MSNSLTRKISSELGPLFKRGAKAAEEDILNVTPPRGAPKANSADMFKSTVTMSPEPEVPNYAGKKAAAVGGIGSAGIALTGDTQQGIGASGSWGDDSTMAQIEEVSKDELKQAEPIAKEIDNSLSSAIKATDWKPRDLSLQGGKGFDAIAAEEKAASEAANRVSAQTATAMRDYTNTVKDIQNLYRLERDTLKKQELWEGLIQAAGLIASGVYGLRSGVDMSGVRFQPSNWQAKLAESREHMQAMLDQAEKEMGAQYKNMELTERTRDKLLDNAYKAWQAENYTIEQNNKRKQAEYDAWRNAELLGISKEQAQVALELSKAQLATFKQKQAEIAARGISPEKEAEMKADQKELYDAMQEINKSAKFEDDEMRLSALKLYKAAYDKIANKYGLTELALESGDRTWFGLGRAKPISPDTAIEKGSELMQQIGTVVPQKSSSLPSSAPKLPAVGEVRGGYQFIGGDPSKPTSWKKVN